MEEKSWSVGMGDEKKGFKVICADCGQSCEIPFEPTEGRDVYCQNCLPKHKSKKLFLKDGEYQAEITDVKLISAKESNTGNPYFKWFFSTPDGLMEAITTLLKGKRWLLKQTLSACGIEADPEDPEQKYTFAPKDVVGKTVVIKILNKPNSFTNKKGELVTTEKSEVKSVRAVKEEGEPTIGF